MGGSRASVERMKNYLFRVAKEVLGESNEKIVPEEHNMVE